MKDYSTILFSASVQTTRVSGSSSPYNNGTTPEGTTTTTTTTVPAYTCEDEVALIPEQTNAGDNAVIPRYFVKPQTPYKPTDINPGEIGISFPSSDKAYIIIFPIVPASIIKYIRLPKTCNVDQIRVMFLDDQDKPLPAQPSDTTPLQITSKLENSPKINVNFPNNVHAVHITLIHTNDNQPPRSVTVEIIVCVEPKTTTEETTATPSSETSAPTVTIKPTPPPSNYSATTPCKNMNSL